MLMSKLHTLRPLRWWPAAALLLVACPAEGPDDPSGDEPTTAQSIDAPVDDGYEHCDLHDRLGAVVVDLGETYPTIYGFIADGVQPFTMMDTALTAGDCELLMPPELFCAQTCAGGETCDVNGECIPSPSNQPHGTVELVGLSGDVSMDPIAPTQVYSFNGDIPYPPYEVGDPIEMYAHRYGDGFALVANGVERLELLQTDMDLASGDDSVLAWTPPTSDVDARVRVSVNIANHGGVAARIECVADDTGSLTIPSSLVTGLLDVGFSGFPSVTLSRQSADTVDLDEGCAEFLVHSEVTLPVVIPGLTSCSNNDDCPDGQSCQPDLTCG